MSSVAQTAPSERSEHLTTTADVLFDMEAPVREAVYCAEALNALTDLADAHPGAADFLVKQLLDRVRKVEIEWERAFRLSRAH